MPSTLSVLPPVIRPTSRHNAPNKSTIITTAEMIFHALVIYLDLLDAELFAELNNAADKSGYAHDYEPYSEPCDQNPESQNAERYAEAYEHIGKYLHTGEGEGEKFKADLKSEQTDAEYAEMIEKIKANL